MGDSRSSQAGPATARHRGADPVLSAAAWCVGTVTRLPLMAAGGDRLIGYRLRVRRLVTVAVVMAAVVSGLGLAPATASADTAGPGYSTELLHFAVRTGPDRATPCTIVGQLYRPDGVSSARRAPAILTTNGFGGSYRTQEPVARFFAAHGYVVLAYSGLGFGGSSCPITLDDPDYDGVAASQLVSYLGGASDIAFTDAALRQPAPRLDVVTHDATDHAGRARTDDPRIGMVGGSYGGGIQFATAATDPRVDTLIPLITWNDLSYSLAPNATSTIAGVSSRVSGAAKIAYSAGLFASGVRNPGLSGYRDDPARVRDGCPNFTPAQCRTFAESATTGQLAPASVTDLRHASVATYIDRIRIPVLLGQGIQDTLFDLNEATATYQALRARGVETKMIWHSWGHSGDPAPGDYSAEKPDAATQYETRRMLDWFDHHLRGSSVDTGPDFAYFRNWVRYSGIATPAYASGAYPVGTVRAFTMGAPRGAGAGSLVTTDDASPGATRIATMPLGLPNGTGPLNDAPKSGTPVRTIPGTYANWDTTPVSSPMDVVGIGTMTLRIRASGQPVIFVKVYDVAPDGTPSLIDGLVSPARIADPSRPVDVRLSGLVHRFDTGHRLRIRIAGGDPSFRGGLQGQPVTILSGPGSSLRLPVVG